MKIYALMIQNKKKKENEKFILNNEPIQQLRESYNYIRNFLFCLRNDEELMFKIIQKASIEDSENCLSKLLINNFYENILSASYIEDELLTLIGRSLRENLINILSSFNYY